MKKPVIIFSLLAAVVIILCGFLVPLGEYATTQGHCGGTKTETVRLQVIHGDAIQKAIDSDIEPGPIMGCAALTKYVLYFL